MRNTRKLFLPFSWCKACIFLLFFLWIFGIAFGCILGSEIHRNAASWMRTAPVCCVSIVSVLAVSLLPFLLTAFAVYFSQTWLILPLAFYKAFSFSFFSVITIFVFEGGGWLIRLLMMFPNIALVALLFLLWLRVLCGKCDQPYRNILICSGISTAITLFDYLCISPYLAFLIP